MMKFKSFLKLFLFVAVFFATSRCELDLGNCEYCCLVTYDSNGNEVSRTSCGEYCDEELEDFKSLGGSIGGDLTTVVECD